MRYCENVVDPSYFRSIDKCTRGHVSFAIGSAWLSGDPRLLQARSVARVLDTLDCSGSNSDPDVSRLLSRTRGVRYLWVSAANVGSLFLALIPLGWDFYIAVKLTPPSFTSLIGTSVVTRTWGQA